MTCGPAAATGSNRSDAIPPERSPCAPTAFGLAGLVVLLAAARCPAEEVTFQDTFKKELSDKWQVVGLDKKDYRIRDGGLEVRVQPGKPKPGSPMFKVFLPFTSQDTVTVSVKVTLLDEFTVDGEFAGVFLLADEGTEFRTLKDA